MQASTLLTNIGYALDDPTNQKWTPAQLLTYINEASVDIARRAEVLLTTSFIKVLSMCRDYIAPQDVIRIYKVEFQPYNNSLQIWPLEYRGIIEMDAVWGINQFTPSAWPNVWTTWQNPPQVLIRLYPMPSQPGTLNVYYYRLPVQVQAATDLIDTPSGWEDMITEYAVFMALQQDADPRWQERKTQYEAKMGEMIDKTRKPVDAPGNISTGFNPYPYYQGFGDGGW